MKTDTSRAAKTMRLKNDGVFNRNWRKVVDERFKTQAFFDEQDIVQVKYEMLRRVEKDGWQIARAAREFGLSRPAFYQAQRLFNEKGLFGLVPQRRGPKGGHKLSDEVLDFVENKRKEAKFKTNELVQLIEEKFELKIHRRSLERALSRRKKKAPATADA